MRKLLFSICWIIAHLLLAQGDIAIYTSIEEANKAPLEVKILDLSGQRLKSLPEDVYQYKNLERLKLNDTFIETLPGQIGTLTALKALEIHHFNEPNLGFKALPAEITNLRNLNYLGLIGVPALNWEGTMSLIGQLPAIDNLGLMFNDFEVLPPGIEQVTTLRKLWLGGNTNLDMEDVFARLPFLEQVGCGGCQLRALPTNVSNAVNISNLWLAGNRLKSVKPLIGLQALQTLTLNKNQLKKLPKGIDSLPLVQLSLDDNPEMDLVSVLIKLAEMPDLKRLSLGHNNLNSIPEEMGLLGKLEVLALRGNEIDDASKERLRQLLPNTDIIY